MATNAVLRPCTGDICLDMVGNVFFSNTNGVMRIDAVTGIMTRIAGGGTDFGTVDTIPATSIGLEIRGLCFDADGYLLLAPSTSAVIRLNLTTGYFTPVAGVWGMGGYTGDGGPATAARMQAWKVRLDAAGNMYILDNWHSVVRKVDAATGIIRTIGGDGFSSFTGDGGPATAGRFNRPTDMVLDSAGNIYIADRENFRVRKIDAVTGILSTVAGSGGSWIDTSGIGGMATAARISRVQCLAIDDTGYLYLGVGKPYSPTSVSGMRILRLNLATGIITSWAEGNMVVGDVGYPGSHPDTAYLIPTGICFDTAHNLYMADVSCRVRKIWAPPHEGGGGGDTGTVATAVVAGRQPVAVYPNPVGQVLHVGSSAVAGSYTLCTVTGMQVASGQLPAGVPGSIPVGHYPAGIYLLQLHWANGDRNTVKVWKE
jgi:hypothetical protein